MRTKKYKRTLLKPSLVGSHRKPPRPPPLAPMFLATAVVYTYFYYESKKPTTSFSIVY